MSSIFTIAEIGQAHDGSLGILHSYIDAVSKTGVDAIKFQTHIAQAESSSFEPFRVDFSYVDPTRFDYWKRMEFSKDQWMEIKSHCDQVGLEFISSPFSNAAVDLLEFVGVKRYKIGSGEITNLLLLEKVAATGKAMILSSGMSDYEELDHAIVFLEPFGNHISLLQCTTAYPTEPDQWGLNLLSELKSRYGCPVGFSDHSGKIYPGLAAAALGAEILEFHVVFNKQMFGPDAKASLTLKQTKKLVKGIRKIEQALANPIDKEDNSKFKHLKAVFEKSLSLNKDLSIGQQLTVKDLEAKKPAGKGIAAKDYQHILGKKLRHNKQKWDFLNYSDLEDE